MNNQPFNKQELQKEVDAKARASVQNDKGLDELVRFTLDSFAYRFLESENSKDLKSFAVSTHLWRVEGAESDLIEALKVQNSETRKLLISKAKMHAKKDGATVYPWLEIQIVDHTAVCKAGIDWETKGERETVAMSQAKLNFEDGLDLRNHLAKVLEDCCGVF